MAVSVCTIMFIKRKASGGNGRQCQWKWRAKAAPAIVKDDLVTSVGPRSVGRGNKNILVQLQPAN